MVLEYHNPTVTVIGSDEIEFTDGETILKKDRDKLPPQRIHVPVDSGISIASRPMTKPRSKKNIIPIYPTSLRQYPAITLKLGDLTIRGVFSTEAASRNFHEGLFELVFTEKAKHDLRDLAERLNNNL